MINELVLSICPNHNSVHVYLPKPLSLYPVDKCVVSAQTVLNAVREHQRLKSVARVPGQCAEWARLGNQGETVCAAQFSR